MSAVYVLTKNTPAVQPCMCLGKQNPGEGRLWLRAGFKGLYHCLMTGVGQISLFAICKMGLVMESTI